MLITLIVGATIAAFSRAVDNHFLVWDDLQYLVNNPAYKGLGWSNLAWAFSFQSARWGHYMPLVWLTWSLDYALWGMDPAGYIFVNILFHAANAVVFYLLTLELLRLTTHRRPHVPSDDAQWKLQVWSALAALFFAIHPLRVESVAWITERKDVVSGLFYLLTVYVYVRGRGRRIVVPLLLFVLAVLSKCMVVSLPVVLIVLDVYPLRRLGGENGWFGPAARRVWLAKVPFLALAAVAAALAPLATRLASASWQAESYNLITRASFVAYSIWFYVYKTILPLGLSPLYERPRALDPASAKFLIAFTFTILTTVLLIALRRRFPAGLAVWVCYGAILAPVAGFVPVGPQIVADRYSYLACLGFAVLLAAGGLRLSARIDHRLLVAVAVLILAPLGLDTWRQIGFWKDSTVLWERALAVEPDCARCHLNLGAVLLEEGELNQAKVQLERALDLDPDNARANYDFALLSEKQGHPQQAIEHYRRSLAIQPQFWRASSNLSQLLRRRGQFHEAIEVLRGALAADPREDRARLSLAWLLATCQDRSLRDGPEAVRLAEQVVQATGGTEPIALHTLAAAYLQAGDRELALQTARRALTLALQQGDDELAARVDRLLGYIQSPRPGGRQP
jgi:tetratricopeptide (TPR) repeat protein